LATQVKLVAENAASGKVKDVYEEIKKTLGIPFVPNLFKAMAPNPDFWKPHGDSSNRSWEPES
jgi:hypothetical protein